jgi:DNA-binding response OmpR family regulator
MSEKTHRLLLVDDEPDITYIIEFILSTSGFDVVRCNASKNAIPELLSQPYDLMLLDLMMPEVDGFEVLKAVREKRELAHLPVLILSSMQLSREQTSQLTSLKAEMMTKPFEPQRLLDKVREMAVE